MAATPASIEKAGSIYCNSGSEEFAPVATSIGCPTCSMGYAASSGHAAPSSGYAAPSGYPTSTLPFTSAAVTRSVGSFIGVAIGFAVMD